MLLDPTIHLARGSGSPALPPMVTKDACSRCPHDWHGLKCRNTSCPCPTSFVDATSEASEWEKEQARRLIGAVLCCATSHERDLPCQFCGAAL